MSDREDEREEFWKLSYLAFLNDSNQPTPEGGTYDANKAANLAVDHLDTFLDGEELKND